MRNNLVNRTRQTISRKFNQFNISAKQLPGKSIYLDYAATTPVDFRVTDAMLPFMTNVFGNPHSRSHMYGWETEKATEDARKSIAELINAEAKEIIFTSGATESNNLAIKGMAKFYGGLSFLLYPCFFGISVFLQIIFKYFLIFVFWRYNRNLSFIIYFIRSVLFYYY